MDAALWVDALRSYLTLRQRGQVWYHLRRGEEPFKVWPLEIHATTELQEKRRDETETLFRKESVFGGERDWKFRGQRLEVKDEGAF